jgi:acyl carrier protein
LFDSLAFVQLISGIEKEFNLELDTGDLDPEEFTVLGNLVRAAAESPAVAPEAEKK